MQKKLFLFCILTLQSFFAFSQQPSLSDVVINDEGLSDTTLAWPLRMQSKIDKLLTSKMIETSDVGILVYDLDTEKTLYEHNSRHLLRPASTMKTITAITALDKLGADYFFKTSLFRDGSVRHGILEGNIYCKGGMDPSFGEQQMNYFIETIKQNDIHTIKGNLVADVSIKDSLLWGEGWCWDDDNPTLTPLLYNGSNGFLNALREKLEEEGVKVLGNDAAGIVPEGAVLVAENFTSLPFILMQMMKDSDNLYAESMLYQLGASASEAQTAIKEVFDKAGVEKDGYRLADGSGLSLYNYLSADLEVKMLRYAFNHNEIYNTLLPTLPIAGVDGTLASRMKEAPVYGNVFAKTGTVSGVSALAGYLTAPDGHNIAFSIINQGVMKSKHARFFQDKVCEAMKW